MDYPKAGDNGKQLEEDWILSGESLLLMNKIKELPVYDDVVRFYDQYIIKEHRTACTMYASYNIYCTTRNRKGDNLEAGKVIELGKERGYKGYPNGWSSSEGMDTVRHYFNKDSSKRQIEVGGIAWEELMKKRVPINISIKVDSKRWEEAEKGEIINNKYKASYGHSDTLQRIKDSEDYEMLDSVRCYRYTITKERFFKLVENGNIRTYAYVLLAKDIFDMPELNKLPDHIRIEDVTDFDDKQIIVAREIEAFEWLQKGNELLYVDYTKSRAIERMLIDLAMMRG